MIRQNKDRWPKDLDLYVKWDWLELANELWNVAKTSYLVK